MHRFVVLLFVLTALWPQNFSRFDLMKKSGKVRIILNENYPPLHFQRGGKSAGLEYRMAVKMAEFLELEPVFRSLPVADALKAVEQGEADMALAAISRSLNRGKRVWFSRPYLQVTPAVLVDKRILPQTKFGEDFEDTPIQTVWDLKRLPEFTFVLKKGTVYHEILQENFPGKNFLLTEKDADGLKMLQDGKANGFVQDSLMLDYFLKKNQDYKSRYVLLQGGKRSEVICAALPAGDYTLKNQVDLWIEEAQRQGWLDAWLQEEMK